jgi:energy-coupling factor transporter ATP-binding protein EcfA2
MARLLTQICIGRYGLRREDRDRELSLKGHPNHKRETENGGIISIDGQSGTGKTTLINNLLSYYRLRYPGTPIEVLPLDELRIPWEICTVYKKLVLGLPLYKSEQLIRDLMGFYFEPGTPPISEATLWRNDEIESELKQL